MGWRPSRLCNNFSCYTKKNRVHISRFANRRQNEYVPPELFEIFRSSKICDEMIRNEAVKCNSSCTQQKPNKYARVLKATLIYSSIALNILACNLVTCN